MAPDKNTRKVEKRFLHLPLWWFMVESMIEKDTIVVKSEAVIETKAISNDKSIKKFNTI